MTTHPDPARLDIRTCEMHTGGEPVRIITGGYPIPEGATLLERGATPASGSTICAGC